MILVTRGKLSSLYRNGDMFQGGMPTISTIATISTFAALRQPFSAATPHAVVPWGLPVTTNFHPPAGRPLELRSQ